jgi:hypothetical protein
MDSRKVLHWLNQNHSSILNVFDSNAEDNQSWKQVSTTRIDWRQSTFIISITRPASAASQKLKESWRCQVKNVNELGLRRVLHTNTENFVHVRIISTLYTIKTIIHLVFVKSCTLMHCVGSVLNCSLASNVRMKAAGSHVEWNMRPCGFQIVLSKLQRLSLYFGCPYKVLQLLALKWLDEIWFFWKHVDGNRSTGLLQYKYKKLRKVE